MAITDEVDSTALTLLFKHGKQTILLFAEPLTPFADLKQELLIVLRERYPKGLDTLPLPKVAKIPDSIRQIRLGVPKDQYDLKKGWTELDTADSGIKESPKSLGVKDGGMVAFVFEAEVDANAHEDDLFKVEINSPEEFDADAPSAELEGDGE